MSLIPFDASFYLSPFLWIVGPLFFALFLKLARRLS